MGIEVGGLIGLLVPIADIWAIVNVFGSSASTGAKVVWSARMRSAIWSMASNSSRYCCSNSSCRLPNCGPVTFRWKPCVLPSRTWLSARIPERPRATSAACG